MVADMDGVVVAGLVGQCPPLRDLVDQVRLQHEPALQAFAEPLHYSSDMRPEGGVGQKKFEAISSLDDRVYGEKLHVASSLSCEELCGVAVYDVNVPLDENIEA